MNEPEFPQIPDIPEEIWEQFRRLQVFQEALSGAFPLADLARRRPHGETLKGIEDALQEREKK